MSNIGNQCRKDIDMENGLVELAKLILREKYIGFEKIICDYYSDIESFKNNYKELLLKWIDKDDLDDIQDYLSPEYILMMYANSQNLMFTIDWSGEEYPGQVKGTLTKLLKANNESTFKWSLKEFESSLDFSKLRKGDYITLLFCALDEEIMKKGYQLLFIEMYDDEYHYTILKREKIKSALHINGNDFEMHTSKRYKLYLIAMGNSQAKVMLYLKSKHNIGLKEIKSYVNNLPILMGQGYLTQLKKVEEELKALGCKYEIKE